MGSRATDGSRASKCQQKWPDQPPRPPLGLPDALVAVLTSRLSCHCRQRLRELVDVGLDTVYLVLLSVREQEECLRAIRTFSDKILPDFR